MQKTLRGIKMNLIKWCLVLAAALSMYVFIFNYETLDVVNIMKESVNMLGIRYPTKTFYRESRTLDLQLPEINTVRSKEVVKEPIESISNDSTVVQVPPFDTYEEMIADDAHSSKGRSFPRNALCPLYQNIRKPIVATNIPEHSKPKCRRVALTSQDCKDMVKRFGKLGSVKAGQCNTNNTIKLCTIREKKEGKREEFEVSCDTSMCKGTTMSLGMFNEKIGKIKWQSVADAKRLNKLLKDHVLLSALSPGFALLRCKGGEGFQLLSFPNILKRAKAGKRVQRFNINMILEDSMSRGHFYRMLQQTASTFRDIIYNQSIPSTLLDFDKFQGHASNTYRTVQRLFSGLKYFKSESRCEKVMYKKFADNPEYSCTYGIGEMFEKYKKAGYSTLLQEDHCWHDEWGSFHDPRVRLGAVKNEKTRLKRWKKYVKIVQNSGRGDLVDDYGISTVSCDVYAKYNETSPFNAWSVPNVCFGGRHLASFFLEYVKEYTALNDMAAQPFIAYTHLLTSHDTNGRRIVNDDESLAELFRHAAHLHNTVTIFLSDHGGKATKFAAYTAQGRKEVFQPLLFIIVPHEVRKLLGPEVMNALVENQNRLVGVQDLHLALSSIVDTNPILNPQNDLNPRTWETHSNASPHSTHLRGLFKPVPLNRTCEQMDLTSDVLCLCEGMDKSVSHKSQQVLWAAEYALGTLNNKIQEQYMASLKSKSPGENMTDFYGYGACQRYAGNGITRARIMFADQQQTLHLTLLVKPLDRKTIEVFDVELSYFVVARAHGITLNNLIRVSPYNSYEKCADKGVHPKLCSCHQNHRNNSSWREKLFSKVASQISFQLKPKTQFLDEPCLAVISRTKTQSIGLGKSQDAVITYEALNACANVKYKLSISFRKVRKTKLTLEYPKTVILLPRTVTYLLTALNEWKYGKFIPRFKFEKTMLT